MSAVLGWIAGSGLVQGLIIGLTFAFLTTILILDAVARRETVTVNGWSSIRRAGRPSNGVLVRAALQKALPVVNSFEEAAYWTANHDASGARVSGRSTYRLHFPADGLPPNGAFWSLAATDAVGYLVHTPTGRSSVNSHSDLVGNADGSMDIVLRADPPTGSDRNWLATPSGRFKLMLRAYLPGAAVIDGSYQLPPVIEVP